MSRSPTALIAEDEPLLAASLQAELAAAWPALQVVAVVGDGESAVSQSLALQPDVLFFDVRMPVRSGIDAAVALADDWPDGRPFPALVFVTAYDEYALRAFEAQALDYLLKPVRPERLRQTVERVRERLAARAPGGNALETAIAQLRGLLDSAGGAPTAAAARLTMIPVAAGASVRLVPVDDVVMFEAADKYVRVLTRAGEYLIRTPLKDLLPQLDPAAFWRVHRGTVVRAAAIDQVVRDESGKLSLTLRGRVDRVPVSRLYAHRFKAL